jgi:hypothetical protein
MDVSLHSGELDMQQLRDLAVGEVLRDELEHLELARRQRGA